MSLRMLRRENSDTPEEEEMVILVIFAAKNREIRQENISKSKIDRWRKLLHRRTITFG